MKDRILKFLASEGISPAEFADKIGVQRSSMSHIINGRNYPSASFIQKMLQAYPLVNPRWLMIGEGSMNSIPDKTIDSSATSGSMEREASGIASEIRSGSGQESQNSIDFPDFLPIETAVEPSKASPIESAEKAEVGPESKPSDQHDFQNRIVTEHPAKEEHTLKNDSVFSALCAEEKEIERVFFFYKDKTFQVYRPS